MLQRLAESGCRFRDKNNQNNLKFKKIYEFFCFFMCKGILVQKIVALWKG